MLEGVHVELDRWIPHQVAVGFVSYRVLGLATNIPYLPFQEQVAG